MGSYAVARVSRALFRALILAAAVALLVSTCVFAQTVDRSSMTNKILCGYQGWHCCPGDGNDQNVAWYHWASDRSWIGPTNYNVDIWPDTVEYDAGDLFQVPNTTLSQGGTPYLYSASKQGAVDTHFKWMQEYNIDGVFLQRFANDILDARFLAMRDTVLGNVQGAAATYGRVWAIEYDITDCPEGDLYDTITEDWEYCKSNFGILNDSRYLHHNNMPVVAIWGLGFQTRPGTPAIAASIISYLQNDGCFVVGGVPWGWRDRTGDSKTDAAWDNVYRSFDAITPWTVGAYTTWNDINSYKNRAQADLSLCNSLGIVFMPTAWPRSGWDNMHDYSCGTSVISSRGGQHLWDQFYAYKSIGAPTQFVAMFDEWDEGTAIAKLTDNYPTTGCWFTTEGKGKDWWLRLAGQGGKMLRGEISTSQTIPITSSNSPDNATMVSNTIPSSMNPNQTYNVSVTVQNSGETTWGDGNWFKLGAVNDSDDFGPGRVQITSAVTPGSNHTFNFQMTAPSQTGTYTSDWQMVHEYIRWFGGQLVKQIQVGGGSPPGQATNPSPASSATGVSTSADLSWTAGSGATSHNVYFGTSSPGTYRGNQAGTTYDPGTLSASTTYYWRIDEVNGDGTTTGTVWSFTTGAAAADRLFYNLSSAGASGISDRMTKINAGDGDTTPNTVGGRTGHQNVNANDDYYFYFGVDDGWAYQGSRQDVYIMVTYYDSGSGSLTLQYDGTGGAYTNASSVNFTNTNTWKKATWHITNAYFGNRQNDGADFRVFIGTGVTKTLDLVEVSNVSGPAPGAVTDDLGNPDSENGLTRVVVGDGYTSYDTKGGKVCRKNDAGSNYFYFDCGNALCFEGSYPDLYVTVDYYDTGGGSIQLQYDSASGYYTNASSVNVGSTDTWKQTTWHITDAYFAGRQNDGADFRIYTGNSITRWFDIVRVATTAP